MFYNVDARGRWSVRSVPLKSAMVLLRGAVGAPTATTTTTAEEEEEKGEKSKGKKKKKEKKKEKKERGAEDIGGGGGYSSWQLRRVYHYWARKRMLLQDTPAYAVPESDSR